MNWTMKWGRSIILSVLILNGLVCAYQLFQGVRNYSQILPSFLVVLVLILLFLIQSEKTYLYFQGILAIGVLMEFIMFLTLVFGVILALTRSEHECLYTENILLFLSLISSIGWKVVLMVLCFKCPQLIKTV